MKIDFVPGWWVSLGLHLDFKHARLDIHFLWWIITIGNTKPSFYCGYCNQELEESAPRCRNCGAVYNVRIK